jgi:hypothetical protein
MAYSANVTYSGNGPTATGQILADRASAGNMARVLYGSATFTSDGSATATLNYIDGTQALPFSPSAIIATINGGTSAAKSCKIVDNADGGKTATVTFDSTLANTTTAIVGLILVK